MIRKDKRHTRDSWEMGQKAEQQFRALAIARGYVVADAGSEADRKQHVDFIVNGKKVEVKSAKRISRQGEVQYEKIWVELQGVTGHRGWLFGGADMIAFQTQDGFMLIDKNELRAIVRDKVQQTFVNRPEEALYKQYRRSGRLDVMTLVEASEVEARASVL